MAAIPKAQVCGGWFGCFRFVFVCSSSSLRPRCFCLLNKAEGMIFRCLRVKPFILMNTQHRYPDPAAHWYLCVLVIGQLQTPWGNHFLGQALDKDWVQAQALPDSTVGEFLLSEACSLGPIRVVTKSPFGLVTELLQFLQLRRCVDEIKDQIGCLDNRR